jgi:simple sugar transport system permease protein
MSPAFHKQIIWSLVSIILALLVSAVIMLMAGYDPNAAFLQLAIGAFTRMDQVIWRATPLILTGLSVALAFKCGLFNIGPEGQLYIGSMAATVTGYMIALPYVVHPIACLLVAALAGGLWGFIPGLLKAYRGAHEVVTTMMLSYTAVLFTQYLAAGPLREPGEFQWNAQTPPILDTAVLPNIFGPYLHWGFLVAILCVIGVWFLISRTVLGYELRAVGQNMEAAEYAGIDPKKNVALALALSGGLAGIAGAGEIMGYHHRFVDGWSRGLGFDGITVAVLGSNNPFGCFAAGIFFGALRIGGNRMHQVAHVPAEMVSVIQGLIVLFVAAPRLIDWLADRGWEYWTWIKDEPNRGIPNFAGVVFGGLTIFFALGFTATAMSLNPMIAVSLVIAGLLGFIAFIYMYSRHDRGPILLLLSSILWIVSALLSFLGDQFSIGIVAVMMGGIGIVLALLIMGALEKLQKKEAIQ